MSETPTVTNRQAAELLATLADLLEIRGEQVYKVLAYRRAAESLLSLGRELRTVWQAGELESIPGVGRAIAEKLGELLRTGRLEFYERVAAEVPPGLVEVLRVGDVGPKKAARFWKELGITSLESLERAAQEGRLRALPGMGERSEARILESIAAMRRRESGRVLLGKARPAAEALLEQLRALPGVQQAEAAGSLRRWRETVGDLDLLVAASEPAEVTRAFSGFPQVERVLGRGATKASAELVDGLRVQVWVHPPERFGTALQYATGSMAHNVRLRELALAQGLSLSEHALRREDGSEILCGREQDVYERLGLPWIPPELREDRGEIQAARQGALPTLVEATDVRGELHAHSDWSDGRATIAVMAEAAARAGLRYLVISDHSVSLGVANGLSVERLREQAAAIAEVQARLGDRLRLLRGAEVEIRADGSLDYPDNVLAELDLVTASMHTSLRQSRQQVTERLLGAIRSPHVDIIGHPTGRMIGTRDPADLDMEAVLLEAAARGVALEINAHPERLDLDEAHARRALELGCLLAVNTDAHGPEDFALRAYGLGIARRAWVPPQAVINTWDLAQLQDWLGGRGRSRPA